jgi:tripartite-type tricarboxylate transporter receptor subunit TctC
MSKRWMSAILFNCALCISLGAAAQSPYPNKPVKFVVPYLAGGAPDVLARTLAQELSTRLGEQFIVENRAGAGGNIGAAYVAKAPADGYTLFFASEAPLAINPHIYKSPGFDPIKDFAPITQLVSTAYYVIVCPKLPVATLKELAAYARQKPLTYASTGYGTTMNLAGELLKLGMGFDMAHVPYKGVPPAMVDIMACAVDVGFSAYGSGLPFIKGGKVKALAISTAMRMPETPDVPTLRELGLANMEQVESSFSVLAPAGTPKPIIDLLHSEIVKVMKTKAMQDNVRNRGMTVMINETPAEFAAWIVETSRRYKKIVTDAKISVD